MTDGQQKFDQPRSSPRAVAALDVDVEVAGETRKVRLVSQDIGVGGVFLRTENPAPLWKRVKLSLTTPAGDSLEVSGEVVRSVTPDKARARRSPSGMAVAFDEVSRARRKQLVALVLDLCAERPDKQATAPSGPATGAADVPKPPDTAEKDEADDILDEIDGLLGSMEDDLELEGDASEQSRLDTGEPEIEAAPVEVEVVQEQPVAVETAQQPAPPQDGVQALREFLEAHRRNLRGDTYYHLLGIDARANAEAIENAYKNLLQRLKPPGPPDSLPADLLRELSTLLGKIRKAYAILSKPDRKRAYDFLIDNETDQI